MSFGSCGYTGIGGFNIYAISLKVFNTEGRIPTYATEYNVIFPVTGISVLFLTANYIRFNNGIGCIFTTKYARISKVGTCISRSIIKLNA